MVDENLTVRSTAVATRVEILLAAYDEQCQQSRHYENQHLTVAGIVMAAATAIVTLATFDERLSWRDSWLGGVIVALGMFGLVTTIAYYSRTTRHGLRAEEIRFELDALLVSATLTDMRKMADRRAEERVANFRVLRRLRLHHIWLMLNGLVIAMGVLLIVMSA